MTRARSGKTVIRGRKRLRRLTKGFRLSRHNLFRQAVVTLMRAEAVNPQVMIYLNRLSDLLFVLARVANGQGKSDVLWVPGENR